MRFFYALCSIVFFVVLVYFVGPRPHYDSFDGNPVDEIPAMSELAELLQLENSDPRIDPWAKSEIVWIDSLQRTPYSMVYLHGFSATHHEGYPLHEHLAEKYGMNMFLTRFPDHGIVDSNVFRNIEPKDWIDYGKQAIAIGKAIGEQVILVSTSTGSTVSIYLSAFDPTIAGQILLSPNIDLHDKNSNLLDEPWGYQIGKMVLGGEYRNIPGPDRVKKYWTMQYHINGLIALRELLDQTMIPEVFQNISHPIFLGYYYKDEENKDEIVSIPAMKGFMEEISTPEEQRQFLAFPKAGNHVIGSVYWNPNWENVAAAIDEFIENVMEIKPVVYAQ